MNRVESGQSGSERPRPDSGRMARVLVVEDDLRVARVVTEALRAEGHEVETVHTLRTARLRLEDDQVDLIVLDIGLPDGSGLDFCSELRRTRDTPIIIISAAGSPEERVAGFDAGADDYLGKPLYLTELAVRVAALLRRTGLRSPEANLTGVHGLQLDVGAGIARYGGNEVALTRSEVGLLRALIEDAGTAISTEELTWRVWNYKSFGESNFLHQHMSRMRRKLRNIGHPSDAITTVYGVGYIMRPVTDDVEPEESSGTEPTSTSQVS